MPEQVSPLQMQLKANLERVNARIHHAAAEAGRIDLPVLIAVTKYAPEEAVSELIAMGHKQLGESRVDQLNTRASHYDSDVEWHMIGHLQRNKVKQAIEHTALIHSVDSSRLLLAIDSAAVAASKTVSVLLQCNISGEESKSGFEASQSDEMIETVGQLKAVVVKGLMTMAPNTDDEGLIRGSFEGLAELRDQLQSKLSAPHCLKELSMGMSHDLELAIAAGATMIRIGTDLFTGI